MDSTGCEDGQPDYNPACPFLLMICAGGGEVDTAACGSADSVQHRKRNLALCNSPPKTEKDVLRI